MIERRMGSIPSRPRTNFLEGKLGKFRNGGGEGRIGAIYRETGTKRGRRRDSTCVETQFQRARFASRVSIVYWIGSYQILETRTRGKQNEQSSYACESLASNIRSFCRLTRYSSRRQSGRSKKDSSYSGPFK